MSSLASFSATFIKHCGKGECFRDTTCLKTVVGVSKGMLPVKYLRSNKASFVSVEFHGDHKTHIVVVNQATLSFWDITRCKTVVSTCLTVIM